jgi:hypothetical protein
MNTDKQLTEPVQMTFTQAYMLSLRGLEQYKLQNPDGGPGHEAYAAGCRLSQMVEAISLFAAAQNAILASLIRNIQPDGTVKDHANFGKLTAKITGHYASEIDFALRMEQMARDAVLEEAGVNPQDPNAVAAYFAGRPSAIVIEDAPTTETK